MLIREVGISSVYMGRLGHGTDLLEELTRVCIDKNVTLGRVEAVGAVRNATLGYYDQENRTYEFTVHSKPCEILNLTGNVSIRDGRPFVHAHVSLADHSGTAFGGHLAPGTTVFACEYVVQAFTGDTLVREADAETGLPLWGE